MCMCDPGEKYRCFDCELGLADRIKEYGEELGLTLTLEDAKEVIEHMDEFEIVDIKTGLWDFLDAYEGISHSRDPEFFKEEV